MTQQERLRRRPTRPAAEIEAGKAALATIPGVEYARSLLAQGLSLRQARARFERVLIEVSLADHNYDKTAAGRQLRMTRDTVRRLAQRTQL